MHWLLSYKGGFAHEILGGLVKYAAQEQTVMILGAGSVNDAAATAVPYLK